MAISNGLLMARKENNMMIFSGLLLIVVGVFLLSVVLSVLTSRWIWALIGFLILMDVLGCC